MRQLFIQYAGACLRYHDLAGDGTPILFVHGLGRAGSFDYPQVAAEPALLGHRRLLPDLLGAGFSDRSAGFGSGTYNYNFNVIKYRSCCNYMQHGRYFIQR